jgi:hypothetical protein
MVEQDKNAAYEAMKNALTKLSHQDDLITRIGPALTVEIKAALALAARIVTSS